MPPKKRRKQTNDQVAKAAKGNVIQGSGLQSRIALDFKKLQEARWNDKTRGEGVVLRSKALLSLHKSWWKDVEKCERCRAAT